MESLVLSPQDVENLEAMSDGSTGYFYKMLDYLEKRVEDGVRRGRFSEEAAKADLETALWYSYACNNLDEYESYCRAAQWMAASEGSAEAARCGMWYYRYSCALLYCGRLEEALAYAEKGVAVEPDYVWGWLQLGKLRSHFGDTAGALAAVERGLDLEPGDYEFTTLAREIREGRSLEEMEYHWIDPEQDRRLQAGEAEEGEMADKRLAIACILCDRANLEAVKAALGVTEWEADAPYCTFTMPYGEGTVQGRFFGNEAALSKLSAEWAAALAARLPELDRRGRTFLELRAELQTDGLELAWFTIQRDQGLRLCFQGGGHSQMVLFGADFSLREEGQPALEQPGSAGNFLAFVLLSLVPSAMLCVGFLNYFLPVYLKSASTAQSDIGRIYMLNCLLVIYSGPPLSRLVMKTRSKAGMVCAAGIISALSLLVLAVLPPLPATLLGAVLVGLATGLNIPAQSEYLLRLDIARAIGVDQSMSLLDALQRVGQVLGPLCAGAALLAMGVDEAARLIGAGFILISLAFLVLARPGRAAHTEDA